MRADKTQRQNTKVTVADNDRRTIRTWAVGVEGWHGGEDIGHVRTDLDLLRA
jgi:hypothetical protein